jgi:hemerythrin superfamily protein
LASAFKAEARDLNNHLLIQWEKFMDAITYLKSEHDRFRKTLAKIGKTANITTKKAEFNKFCAELIRHETMEQKVFYPRLKSHPELKDIIKHLLGEEKSAAQTIKKFNSVKFDFMWKLRFYKFSHDVDHHANEEEKELFPKVRKILSKVELAELGMKMQKFKANLK